MSSQANSEHALSLFWLTWKLVGQIPPRRYRALYYLYSLVLNLVVTIWYPLHLLVGLAKSTETRNDIFKNVLITLTVASCSVKTIIMWWNLDKMHNVRETFRKLDRRVVAHDEVAYYQRSVVEFARKFWIFVAVWCVVVAVTSEAVTITRGVLREWKLSYPAFFPFDVYGSWFNYFSAHVYQIVAGSILLAQNLCNDTYGTVALMLLNGHIHTLSMRIARIGYEGRLSTRAQNNATLLACVQDHRDLLELCETIEGVISWCMYLQIILASVSICVTIVYIIFYVNDIIAFIYFMTHLLSMFIEIFPCCYCGTHTEQEFNQLTYAIFSSNWIDQSKLFKQNLRIFAEQSLKKKSLVAGGMIPINLDSYFATCKGAYSLYAVLKNMK